MWSQALKSLVRGGRLVTCGATSGDQPGADLRRMFIRQLQVLGSTLGDLHEFADLLARAARETNSVPAGFSVDIQAYLLALPSIVLFGTLVLLVLTSFTTVLSSLYLSGDIDMLLAAPVPMRAVFVVKFFGGLLTPYTLLAFLLGPFLLGFGHGLGFGAAYFATAIGALLLLPLLPTGLGALLTMAVVRVIPARRAREIVGVIGGMVGISWYILSQFTRDLAPRLANVQTLDYLRRFDNPLTPSA